MACWKAIRCCVAISINFTVTSSGNEQPVRRTKTVISSVAWIYNVTVISTLTGHILRCSGATEVETPLSAGKLNPLNYPFLSCFFRIRSIERTQIQSQWWEYLGQEEEVIWQILSVIGSASPSLCHVTHVWTNKWLLGTGWLVILFTSVPWLTVQ